MMLYKTQWLKVVNEHQTEDWGIRPNQSFPRGQWFFCCDIFDDYFDVGSSNQIRVVAYDRPSKDRYCITLHKDSAGVTMKIDGERYRAYLYANLRLLLDQLHAKFGNKPLYVECEVQ